MEASTCHYTKAAASWGSRPGLPRRARMAQMVVFSDSPIDACGIAARPSSPSPKVTTTASVYQSGLCRGSDWQSQTLEDNPQQHLPTRVAVSLFTLQFNAVPAAPPFRLTPSSQVDEQCGSASRNSDWLPQLIIDSCRTPQCKPPAVTSAHLHLLSAAPAIIPPTMADESCVEAEPTPLSSIAGLLYTGKSTSSSSLSMMMVSSESAGETSMGEGLASGLGAGGASKLSSSRPPLPRTDALLGAAFCLTTAAGSFFAALHGRPAGRFSAEHSGRPQHVFFVTLPSGPSGCLGQGHARALVRPMKMSVLRQVLPRRRVVRLDGA